MEKGLISFFDVSHCGFYKIKQKQDHVFHSGSMKEIISAVETWVSKREVRNTIPWDISSNPYRQRVYCKSTFHNNDTGDYLFVFWKQYGEDGGNVNGIVGDSAVGDRNDGAHLINAKVGDKDLILGQPMYYWFIPSKNILASIKFPHSLSDTDDVAQYIRHCVTLRIDDPRKKIHESPIHNHYSGRDIITKRVTYNDPSDDSSLTFKFKAETKELRVTKEKIKSLANKISHIVVRETISSTKKVEGDGIFTLWGKLNKKRNITNNKQVEIITDEELTPRALYEMLKVYQEERNPDSIWDKLGFKCGGRDKPTKWFDSYIEKKSIQLSEDSKVNNSYFPAKIVLEALTTYRNSLLDFTIEDEVDWDINESIAS